MRIPELAFDKDVLARLLFDKQLQVGRHQVHTSLYAQPFADERRLEDGFSTVESAEDFIHNILDVLHLPSGLLLEGCGVKVGTGGEVQCLFPEVGAEGVLDVVVSGMVDDVIECSPGEVTQHGIFVGRPCTEPVNREEQRVVSVTLKAVGDGGYIQQIVGLYDDEPWHYLPVCDGAVEEVQLHPLAQQRSQIAEVDIFRRVRIVYRQELLTAVLVGHGHLDCFLVPLPYDAADVTVVCNLYVLRHASVFRYPADKERGNRLLYDGRDEESEGTAVVSHVVGQDGCAGIAVPAHLLDGDDVLWSYVMLPAERLYLRREVAETVAGLLQSFVTGDDECLVHDARLCFCRC